MWDAFLASDWTGLFWSAATAAVGPVTVCLLVEIVLVWVSDALR